MTSKTWNPLTLFLFFLFIIVVDIEALSDACLSRLAADSREVVREIEAKFELQCEVYVDGGGWIVLQHNIRGKAAPFTSGKWLNYAKGFQNNDGIFWMGLENVAKMTSNHKWQLMIKVRWIENVDDVKAASEGWAVWDDFDVDDEKAQFRLNLGNLTAFWNIPKSKKRFPKDNEAKEPTRFDPMEVHKNQKFSTPDANNEEKVPKKEYSCAAAYRSGWWFADCYNLSLNRDPPAWYDGKNVHWLGESIMALRPKT